MLTSLIHKSQKAQVFRPSASHKTRWVASFVTHRTQDCRKYKFGISGNAIPYSRCFVFVIWFLEYCFRLPASVTLYPKCGARVEWDLLKYWIKLFLQCKNVSATSSEVPAAGHHLGVPEPKKINICIKIKKIIIKKALCI